MNRLIFSVIVFIVFNLIGNVFASVPPIGNSTIAGPGNKMMSDSADNQSDIDSVACDRYLDAWEQFIVDVTPLLEKVMIEGDIAAVQKYSDIVAHYAPLLLDSAQIYAPLLSEAQIKRFEALSTKYTEKMQSVQKLSQDVVTEEDVEVIEDDNGDIDVAVNEVEEIQPTNFGCDRVIDEYDKMMDQYILIYKKIIANSDTSNSAHQELYSLTEKMQALSLEMANCNFSDEDEARLQKISEKLANEIQSLSE